MFKMRKEFSFNITFKKTFKGAFEDNALYLPDLRQIIAQENLTHHIAAKHMKLSPKEAMNSENF